MLRLPLSNRHRLIFHPIFLTSSLPLDLLPYQDLRSCVHADVVLMPTQSFQMNCGLRHGTKYLYVDSQPTLKGTPNYCIRSLSMPTNKIPDCMDACGALLPCHSVDYERRTQTCYYSNHHGAPQIVASGFDSARTMGCAAACGECCTRGCGGTTKGEEGM
jgi:hypothetical protein